MSKSVHLLFIISVMLIGCHGLSPEPRDATFIYFDNSTNYNLTFYLNSDRYLVHMGRIYHFSVEPGGNVVEVLLSSGQSRWGPDTIYVAPCAVETLRLASDRQ